MEFGVEVELRIELGLEIKLELGDELKLVELGVKVELEVMLGSGVKLGLRDELQLGVKLGLVAILLMILQSYSIQVCIYDGYQSKALDHSLYHLGGVMLLSFCHLLYFA